MHDLDSFLRRDDRWRDGSLCKQRVLARIPSVRQVSALAVSALPPGDGEPGLFPGRKAAIQRPGLEAALTEQRGGRLAARDAAVHHVSVRDNRPTARNFIKARCQLTSRNVPRSGDMPGGVLLGPADIDDRRRVFRAHQRPQILDAEVLIAHHVTPLFTRLQPEESSRDGGLLEPVRSRERRRGCRLKQFDEVARGVSQ